jgi:hypothetical protein
MSVTTISMSGTLPLLSAGQTYVVTGQGVDVTSTEIYVGAGDHFTVQDGATIDLSGSSIIGMDAINFFTIGMDGTLILPAGLQASVLQDGVTFAPDSEGGDLVLKAGNTNIQVLTSSIANFGYLDNIDFQGFGSPVVGDTIGVSSSGGLSTFAVTTSSGLETFTLMGDYVGDSFSVSADGAGGFNFTDETPPCFAEGTRILTIEGEVPVENLKVGDVAVLYDGQESPIIFIGTRFVNLARHARPDIARPVRIPAGALAGGVPARDLLVSPDHALFLDDVLVPAKDLVDGVMITQDKSFKTIRYYHVELEDHGILLAEGTPAESFLNLGHRGIFDNSDEPVILHPELMRAREMAGVAPLVTGGEHLATIRARLYARALMRGYRVVQAPDIALAAGNHVLSPVSVSGNVITFALPADTRNAVLLTDVFTPAELDPFSADRRTLGVAIADVLLDGKFTRTSTVFNPADLHGRGEGETAIWTRGRARLTWPAGTRTLSIRVTGWPKRWQATAKAA